MLPRTYVPLRAALAASIMLTLPMELVRADDIDIYSVPSSPNTAPNIVILLDNTSNWSANNQSWQRASVQTKCVAGGATEAYCEQLTNELFKSGETSIKQGQMEVRALKRVIQNVLCTGSANAPKVNLGLAMLSDGAISGGNGAHIVHAATLLAGTIQTAGSSCKAIADKLDLIDANITAPQWKAASNAHYGGGLFEIFKYYGGWTSPAGARTQTAGSPVSATGYGAARFSEPSVDMDDPLAFTSSAKTIYRSPIGEQNAECGKNYLMVVSNGAPKPEDGVVALAAGHPFGQIPTITSGATQETKADEWAWFLANTDVSSAPGVQSIYSYSVNVFNANEDVNATKLMKSIAKWGGLGSGAYFEVSSDANKMVEAFTKILTNIAAIDSVYTATSLPVSTTTQGSYINQLFMGMFRPDEQARPRWWGNMKQYQLGLDVNNDLQVVDQNGAPAIEASRGFFAATATSFWSSSSAFFAERPSGTPATGSDAPDGAVIEKGGAAQQLRVKYASSTARTARKIFTAAKDSSSLVSLAPGITGTDNGGTGSIVLTESEAEWIRGANNVTAGAGQEIFTGTQAAGVPATVRASIHGDVLHSRPVALNYGKDSDGVDQVVVFYGSNDGLLRAIDGRKTGASAGQEFWAFLPPEAYDHVRRIRNGSPEILLPVHTETGALNVSTTGQQPRGYGFDGPIGVFAAYSATRHIQRAMIFGALRRGGGALYAFDVTDTASGAGPALAWVARQGPTFPRLAQTWSMPKGVILPKAQYGGGTNVVAVFGAGYNPQEDDISANPGSSTLGRALYVVDAFTGAKRLELTGIGANAITASVASDVTVADTDLDGAYDRVYFADVRGGVYRADIGGAFSSASWPVKKIAQVAGKVFHAPDVVVTRDFVAVIVGTGDREKPLMKTTSEHVYMIKDTLRAQTETPFVITAADLKNVARVAGDGTVEVVTSQTSDTHGCYFSLATNGEKVVNTPLTLAGIAYFGTNKPPSSAANSCTGSLGEARAYQWPLFCKAPTSTLVVSGGYPPSPVGGLVSVGGQLTPFIIGSGTNNSAFEAQKPPRMIEQTRKRSFWRIVPSGPGNR